MILVTWNVNSLSVRLEHVLAWIVENKPTVLCLQETKTRDENFPVQAFSNLGYECAFFGEKAYNGVAIISNRPINKVQKGFIEEPEENSKRFIEAEIDSIKILNTYIPNGQAVGSEKFSYKLNWLAALNDHIKNSHKADSPLIWCGDFNIAPSDIDVYDPVAMQGQIMCSDQERGALKAIEDWGFIDAFRLKEKEAGFYSWWDYRVGAFRRNMGWRIDHIWITEPLKAHCQKAWIDKAPRKLERPSDHAPVALELSVDLI